MNTNNNIGDNGEKKKTKTHIRSPPVTMANVFLISSRNRRSLRTSTDSKNKNLTLKRSESSSDNNYSCKKHPKHRQSPGICSLCLTESLSKLSLDFYDYSSSMTSSSSKNVAKTVSSCSSASSESESESDYSSTAISSYYSSVSSCLSPLQHRYSEIVVNKKKKKHPKKQNFLSRLFL
ncbi:hypothetical protein Bca4012_062342 [Brassica carinata]